MPAAMLVGCQIPAPSFAAKTQRPVRIGRQSFVGPLGGRDLKAQPLCFSSAPCSAPRAVRGTRSRRSRVRRSAPARARRAVVALSENQP